MAPTSGRQFVQQTALAAAPLYRRPIEVRAGARRILETRGQNGAPLEIKKSTTPRMCCATTRTSSRIRPRVIEKRRARLDLDAS